MAYVVDTVTFPRAMSGAPSCKEQHELYALEKIRVDALSAQLGQEAAQCHSLHGDYDSAAAAAAAQQVQNALCSKSLAQWEQAAALFATNADCEKYLKVRKEYEALVTSAQTLNTARKTAWLLGKAGVDEYNKSADAKYAAQQKVYKVALALWEAQTAAYNSYISSIISQSNSLEATWNNTRSKTPSIKDYQFSYMTNRCGTRMRCMPQAEKTRLLSGPCVVLKGLGATIREADQCLVAHYYPACPTTACKTPVAKPGAKPSAPNAPSHKSYAAEPSYSAIPTWDAFRNSKGVPTDLNGCDPKKYPNPGSRPGCNPNAPIPPVPAKPTCTPPQIPAMPVAPTCKPTVTSQMGTMWLVLAVGAGGLYWYSKKK